MRRATCLSFPKIISGRICDAAQPRSELRQWRQTVGRLDARGHLSVVPSACALDCNTAHRRKEFAAGALAYVKYSSKYIRVEEDARTNRGAYILHLSTSNAALYESRNSLHKNPTPYYAGCFESEPLSHHEEVWVGAHVADAKKHKNQRRNCAHNETRNHSHKTNQYSEPNLLSHPHTPNSDSSYHGPWELFY